MACLRQRSRIGSDSLASLCEDCLIWVNLTYCMHVTDAKIWEVRTNRLMNEKRKTNKSVREFLDNVENIRGKEEVNHLKMIGTGCNMDK